LTRHALHVPQPDIRSFLSAFSTCWRLLLALLLYNTFSRACTFTILCLYDKSYNSTHYMNTMKHTLMSLALVLHKMLNLLHQGHTRDWVLKDWPLLWGQLGLEQGWPWTW